MSRISLHDLISNHNLISSGELKTMVEDAGNNSRKNFAEAVFGTEFLERLLKTTDEYTLKDNATAEIPSDYSEYTQVYFWGCDYSGKTSVIGALAAVIEKECEQIHWNKYDGYERIETLKDYFGSLQQHFEPLVDQNTEVLEVYNVDFRYKGRKYCLSLIEASIDYIELGDFVANTVLKNIINKKNNKIHFICFDSSLSQSDLNAQEQTIQYFLDEIVKNKCFKNYSVGIYLLVTKTDLMIRVPKEYRASAAQTLITAGYKRLWQRVVNLCYDMEVYDSTPIPFSVGKTELQDILTPDLSCAEAIFEKPIMLKTQPCLNTFEKFLRKGNTWTSLAVAGVFVVVLTVIGYMAASLIPTAPNELPPVYNFTEDFMSRENSLITDDVDPDKLVDNYLNLNWELLTESEIRTSDGYLLTDVSDTCRISLDCDCAAILLNGKLKTLFDSPNWSKYSKLKYLKDVLESIKIHRNENKIGSNALDELNVFAGYINTSYNIKKFTYKSQSCRSLKDVQDIKKQKNKYDKYPYNTETTLNRILNQFASDAEVSYAKHLLGRAQRIKKDYDNESANNYNGYKYNNYKGYTTSEFRQRQIYINDKYRQQSTYLRSEIQNARNVFDSDDAQNILYNAGNILPF